MVLSDLFFRKLEAATTVFRKDVEVVRRSHVGPIEVTEVFDYPHKDEAPADISLHDLVFVDIGVDHTKAEEAEEDLIDWLRAYPSPERLLGGPSYIEFAGAAGVEQETAFRIFALAEDLGLARIMTFRSLVGNAPEDQVREMAGKGMLMLLPKGPLVEALA